MINPVTLSYFIPVFNIFECFHLYNKLYDLYNVKNFQILTSNYINEFDEYIVSYTIIYLLYSIRCQYVSKLHSNNVNYRYVNYLLYDYMVCKY